MPEVTQMQVHDDILKAVGHTPLVRLNKVTHGLKPQLYAKVETMNPGGSVKDRIGLKMLEVAERKGLLRPGGTVVEPTSGNTGVGLAIAAALKGYRIICVMPDKMSQEKIALLRAYGADVVITPTAVPRESPQSYYSVADRLANEIPGAFQPNQYFNPANPQAHYETTGPELWEQTDGRIDVFVAGMGTGGTITGAGRYLKERKSSVQIVGADPLGSIYYSRDPNSLKTYKVEGIGEDFYPSTMDLTLVDRIVPVSDKDSFLTARRVTREEGILVGGSAGSAVFAALEVAREMDDPEAVMVVVLPDSGRSYLSKIYNDDWMRQNGFLEQFPARAVREVLRIHSRRFPKLVAIQAREPVGEAIDKMQEYGISQMPVAEGEEIEHISQIVGSITERTLLDRVYRDPSLVESALGAAMDRPFPVIDASADVDDAFEQLLDGAEALVVAESERPVGVVTKLDLLEFAAHRGRREHNY
jgi:cystathionine beta-synthase